jgi:hypothetical protein
MMTGLMTVQAETMLGNDYNLSVTNASYFVGEADKYRLNNGFCSGNSKAYATGYASIGEDELYKIPCEYLRLPKGDYGILDEDQCNSINGCYSYNESSGFLFVSIYNDTLCKGRVNMSHYGISNVSEYDLCYKSALTKFNKETCLIFGCEWYNQTDNNMYNLQKGNIWTTINNAVDIIFSALNKFFTTIFWVMSFQADVGLGSWNWLFCLIFFYAPFIMLILAVATAWT